MTSTKLKQYLKTIHKTLKKSITVFDLETTGLDTAKDEIIQFAGIRINPDGSTQELTFLCKPTVPIHEKASETHGKTVASLVKEKPFNTFVPQLLELFKDADVAGFNVQSFDMPMLSRQLKEAGHDGVLDNATIYDAYLIFKSHFTHKLADALKMYTGLAIEDAHDALGDVKTTIAVMAEQLALEDKTPIQLSSEISAKALKDKFGFKEDGTAYFMFGKHSGTNVKDVDKGYLKWMVDKGDFSKAVKEFIKGYL